MPTYEYDCKKCGVFDFFQKMSDKALVKCPTCKGKVVRRIGAGAGLIFKGTGFYQTDYKTSGKPQDSKPSDKKADK